ncbi:putative sulfate exporter family transporter [Limosilactobacillus fermentum]
MAHAVAAGSAGGPVSLNTAIITKLSRSSCSPPQRSSLGFGTNASRLGGRLHQRREGLLIPWFMLGFILASVIGTFVPLGVRSLGHAG